MDSSSCGVKENVGANIQEPMLHAENKRSFRNLIIACIGYFLVFTGYWGVISLQSTMNAHDGLGDKSQTIIFLMSMFSALLLPDLLIGKFGCKSMLVLGTFTCTLFVASNIYLWAYTMLTASVIFGIANGVYNASMAFYINEMARRYQACRNSEVVEAVMAQFFGIFIFFSAASGMSGNLISYAVLMPGNGNFSNYTVQNQSCGIHFDPNQNVTNHNLEPPSDSKRHVLIGIYVFFGILGIVALTTLLDPLKNDLKESTSCLAVTSRVVSGLKNLRNPQQLLLLPLTVFCGMEIQFLANEISQAFIACSWGVYHIGFVIMFGALCDALTALVIGPFVKRTSQMAAFIVAVIANLSSLAVMSVWQPTSDTTFILFIIAGAWGTADCIWWSQFPAFYGLLFPEDREAAFANVFFWSHLGSFMSYMYAEYLSIAVKLHLILGFLIVGVVGYFIGQLKIKLFDPRKDYTVLKGDGE